MNKESQAGQKTEILSEIRCPVVTVRYSLPRFDTEIPYTEREVFKRNIFTRIGQIPKIYLFLHDAKKYRNHPDKIENAGIERRLWPEIFQTVCIKNSIFRISVSPEGNFSGNQIGYNLPYLSQTGGSNEK